MEATGHYPDVPKDLLIHILLRLPVKSLLRFTSVSKSWVDLIESPSFIDKHFHHERNPTSFLFYWTRNMLADVPYRQLMHAFTDETLERREELKHLQMPDMFLDIRGPCKGIFCVNSHNYKLALWNPATRRMRPLPAPPRRLSIVDEIGSAVEIGFGVDPLTDEFKVVLIKAGYSSRRLCTEFLVYTSGNDSWRFAGKGHSFDDGAHEVYVSRTECCTAYLNGFYYWRISDIINHRPVLLAFDMHEEVFEEIALPDVNVGEKDALDLKLYDDSLALLSFNSDYFVEDNSIEIWMMKGKGCWTKLFNVVLPFKIFWTIGFWNNSKIFILNYHKELILCDLDSDNTKIVGIDEKCGAISYEIWLLHCKESLISVKVGDGFHDYDINSAATQVFFDWNQ